MRALLLAVLITLADQVSKQVVRARFDLGDTRPVFHGFFDLTYLRNTGAAWGVLGGQNGWLIGVSVAMLALVVFFRRSFLTDSGAHRTALGLMVGGILGNLLDRVRLGYVTDFLDFHVAGRHWPAFNVADSAICLGVAIYVLSTLASEWRRPPAPAEAAAGGPADGKGDGA